MTVCGTLFCPNIAHNKAAAQKDCGLVMLSCVSFPYSANSGVER